MQEDVRYIRNPDFICRRIAEEMVLVPIRQNVADMDCIYTLNPVASLIWEHLGGGATVATLQAAIVQEYDIDPKDAAADLADFLAELETAGAIRSI